jgi:hypothetical protein
MTPQATLTQFAPVDPVWRDLILSRNGIYEPSDEEIVAEKELRKGRGERPMMPHTCRHCAADVSRAYDLGLGPANFIGFCGLKEKNPGRDDLPTFCEAQFWPWYLCPHYAATGACP